MLREAAQWVDALGVVMWEDGELDRRAIDAEVAAGQFVVATTGDEVAGTLRFQLEDPLFWPDLPSGRSAFVHRLVVRRAFKGRGVSQALLAWAVERAREEGREALRLDCDADRDKLRAVDQRLRLQVPQLSPGGTWTTCRVTNTSLPSPMP